MHKMCTVHQANSHVREGHYSVSVPTLVVGDAPNKQPQHLRGSAKDPPDTDSGIS